MSFLIMLSAMQAAVMPTAMPEELNQNVTASVETEDDTDINDISASKSRGPVPRTVSRFVPDSDYPSKALEEKRQGTTEFTVTVGADGRVYDCEITGSSGHRDLDEKTCWSIVRRGRFHPALDANGNPIEGEWNSRTHWASPE